MAGTVFKTYFTLEEAVGKLPWVRENLAAAQAELGEVRGMAILHKRILLTKQESGSQPTDAEVALLHQKYEVFEEAISRWIFAFAEQGIILRDVETGLLDFPYRAQTTRQDYLLCWRLDEDGIFYFHGINEGFAGRHPISVLPD